MIKKAHISHNTNGTLVSISVLDNNNNQIKSISFANHYKIMYDGKKYPMLDSITISSANGGLIDRYEFEYNNDIEFSMPDFWGNVCGDRDIYALSAASTPGMDVYYRNKEYTQIPYTTLMAFGFGGSFRENPASQTGILKSITNAMGCRTEFTYESNYYLSYQREYPAALNPDPAIYNYHEFGTITPLVKATGGLRIRKIEYIDTQTNAKITRTFKYGKEKQAGSPSVSTYPEDKENGLGTIKRELYPENYMHNQLKVILNGVMEYRKSRLRTFFSSLIGNSTYSGSPIVYNRVTEYIETEKEGEIVNNGKTIYNYDFPSYSWNDVEIYNTGGAQLYFDIEDTYTGGKLLSKQEYKRVDYEWGEEYEPVSSSRYTYKYITTDTIPVGKVYQKIVFQDVNGSTIPPEFSSLNNYNHAGYGVRDVFYYYRDDIPVDAVQIEKEIDSLYMENGVFVKEKEYTYANKNHLYPTCIKERCSDGTQKIRYLKYPLDDGSLSDQNHINAKNALINKNILTPVLEDKEENSSGSLTLFSSYKLLDDFPRFSKKIMKRDNGDLQIRAEYHEYDTYGNPLYISKDSMENVVYLWGYKGRFPIAEIKNATFSQVSAIISKDTINSIAEKIKPTENDWNLINSLRTLLINAHVSTYTYKPLVGMLTATDPRGRTNYYEYDSSWRLQTIKDENNKEIQNYDYHYKNQ